MPSEVGSVGLPADGAESWTAPMLLALTLARAGKVPVEMLHKLRKLHEIQWRLEDVSRDRAASHEDISAAKLAIDASNAQRHALIDAIDRVFVWEATTEHPQYYSETPGELCDRLIILDVKCAALAASDVNDIRYSRIVHLCAHLERFVDQLVNGIALRSAVFPARVGVKIYRGQVSSTPG